MESIKITPNTSTALGAEQQCKDSHLSNSLQYPDMLNAMTEMASQKPEFVFSGAYLKGLQTESIPCLYQLWPIGGLSLEVGASDTGKSMLLRQLGMCISGKKEFLNKPFNGEYGRALIVCSEDDKCAISFFLNRQNKSLALSDSDLENIRFIFDTENLLEKLDSELQREPVDCVIIDALGDVFNGKDINSNNQVRQFLQPFSVLAGRHKIAVIFLHHTGKRSEDLAPSKNNSIGSQGIEAKARFVCELRRNKEKEDVRHLCIVKGNYLPASEKNSSIDLYMDENFCFTLTGERTSYEDLISGSSKKVYKGPEMLKDEEHTSFLLALYKKQNTMQSGRTLTKAISVHFGISDKTSRRYGAYYISKGWLVDKSKAKSRQELFLGEISEKLRF
ncbi:MAG: AAA family ATPase [Chryseobacterium sp.]